MSSISSLQKYYRQPKVYISLPSKGEYYPLGCLTGNSEQLPVYGMTGMDEILFKTPDALFTGESIVEVIKSCIPDIKDPWAMPQLDVDTALIAIRIATYGASLSVGFTCSKCNAENDRSFDLNQALAYFSSLYWENTIVLDPLIIYLKPFNYKQNTEFQLKNYQ